MRALEAGSWAQFLGEAGEAVTRLRLLQPLLDDSDIVRASVEVASQLQRQAQAAQADRLRDLAQELMTILEGSPSKRVMGERIEAVAAEVARLTNEPLQDDEDFASNPELKALFEQEVSQHIDSLLAIFLALDRSPDRHDLWQEARRLAHSIKGTAATMGMYFTAEGAHLLEEWIERLRGAKASVADFDSLLDGVEVLRLLVYANTEDDCIRQFNALQIVLGRVGGARSTLLRPLSLAGEGLEAEGIGLRVDPDALARLESKAESLALVQSQLAEALPERHEPAHSLMLQAGGLLSEIQKIMLRLRVAPAGLALDAATLAIREAASREKKRVEITRTGEQLLMERSLLSTVIDPLVHISRNAVTHGIEASEVREGRGKAASGKVWLDVRDRGSCLELSVTDDGQGISPDLVRQALVERGHLPLLKAQTLSDQELLALLFRPGMTTRSMADIMAGRGIGLDVALEGVTRAGGYITIYTWPGRGTSVVLRVPCRDKAIRMVKVMAGKACLALPAAEVAFQVHNPQWTVDEGGRARLVYEQATIPLLSLAGLLDPSQDGLSPGGTALVFSQPWGPVALFVDRIEGELVAPIQPLEPFLSGLKAYSGVIIPQDEDQVFAVPHLPRLFERAREAAQATDEILSAMGATAARVLLVYGTSPVREALVRTLTGAGMAVTVVSTGEQALGVLASKEIDALIADIHLPTMPGLALARRLKRTGGPPLILLTDRDGPKEENGSLIMLTKPVSAEDLLATLRRALAGYSL